MSSQAIPGSAGGGFRIQQRELETEPFLRSAAEPDDSQELGECEVAALAVFRLLINDTNVAPDGLEVTFGAWSVANSESFDEGDVCGDASDRTTSVTAFDSAVARLDGAGFGNLLFYSVAYQATGTRGEVDTSIQSSMVSATVVSSLGGNIGTVVFSAHVNFVNRVSGLVVSLPLLFHTPSLCQAEVDVNLDFYGRAAVGYGLEIGGSLGYLFNVNRTGGSLDFRHVQSAIVLESTVAFNVFLSNQATCDVGEAPSQGPAAWAECSSSTNYVNTSVSVGGCEVLVSPARWMVVGNFFNQTFEERFCLVARAVAPPAD